MIGARDVTVFYDERVLGHQPDANEPFLPGRLDRRVREILSGLTVQWYYPEHPDRRFPPQRVQGRITRVGIA